MRLFSENFHVAPARSGQFASAVVVLAAVLSVVPLEVKSQTPACKDIVADMAAQQKMIGIFGDLDYDVRTHFLIVANAILSTYGGWNSKGANWANDATALREGAVEFEEEAIRIRQDIGRVTAIDDEVLQRLNGAVDSYQRLIEVGEEIAREIDAGKVDQANQIYFEKARPGYRQIHGDVYTLINTAEKKVAKLARTPCS